MAAAATADEFRLVSPAIHHEERIPRKYTDDGQGALKNISPPLEWYNVPEGTKALALVVQDIDESHVVPWVSWIVINIPPTLKGLPEGFSMKEEQLGDEYQGITEGLNDLKIPGWRCPKLPSHGHRWEFRLYALDDEVHLGHKVTKDKLLDAIEGHVLEAAVLTAVV